MARQRQRLEGPYADTAALAPRSLTVTADFKKPFVCHNINEFTLEPSGAATKVTRTWRGQQPLALKVMGVFRTWTDSSVPTLNAASKR